jgi:type II secretory pathway pseudopilin PulG
MQIYSSLLRIFSRLPKRTLPLGFSLVELLVSAGVITLLAAIVLVRFSSFDGTVLLKSSAYDVGVALREAQIYGVSVVNTATGGTSNFRYPYGLSFTPGAQSYPFFRFNSSTVAPRYVSTSIDLIRNINFPSSVEVYDVCVTNSGVDDCTISRLDISFRRPEYSAMFFAPPTLNNASTITAGKIYLRSTRNTSNVWVVEIQLLGQIVVYKQ